MFMLYNNQKYGRVPWYPHCETVKSIENVYLQVLFKEILYSQTFDT